MRLAKVTVAGLLLAAGLPAVRPAAQANDDLAKAPRISFDDFKKGLASGALVAIDVRAREAYRNGHIPGALSIPLAEVAGRSGELRAIAKPVVAYCA